MNTVMVMILMGEIIQQTVHMSMYLLQNEFDMMRITILFAFKYNFVILKILMSVLVEKNTKLAESDLSYTSIKLFSCT